MVNNFIIVNKNLVLSRSNRIVVLASHQHCKVKKKLQIASSHYSLELSYFIGGWTMYWQKEETL